MRYNNSLFIFKNKMLHFSVGVYLWLNAFTNRWKNYKSCHFGTTDMILFISLNIFDKSKGKWVDLLIGIDGQKNHFNPV